MNNITITIMMFTVLTVMIGWSQDSKTEARTSWNHGSIQHSENELLKKSTEQDKKEFEGMVEEKRLLGDFYQILVHPGQSTGPTYFHVSQKTYDQIDVGMKVLVFEVPDGVVHFSSPPIQYADEVNILSK